MAASSARCTAPPRRGEGGDAPGWRPPGPCLLAAVLLLASWSDACVLPPPFEAMDPIDPKPYYKIGEKVEYKCKKGYNRLPFYLMVATCEKNHTWVPITDDACITGNEILYCELKEDKVQWSSSVPKCKNLLGPPPKITNGNYTFSDITMFQYFEAVTYSCNPTLGPDQLSLVGSEVLYCAAHETWSSAAPECKVIKCPSPVLKDGRQLSGFGKSFYYKAMVKFECMAGFYLNGSNTIMCGTENAWEPSIPQCIKGPRPTQPVKSPVYNYPGYPNPHEGLFDQELNVWISLLMLLVLVVAVAVLPLFVHRCVEHHNKSTKLTDDSHKEIKFTSL